MSRRAFRVRERAPSRVWNVLAGIVVYGLAIILATLIVSLAWTSLQRPGLQSSAERLHRDIAECSAAYRTARSGRDSSWALDRIVRGPDRINLNTLTCRDLLFGQPYR